MLRFQDATADRIVALGTDADLDEYTYSVAGCVGEFWTLMCRAHVFPRTALDDSVLLAKRHPIRQGPAVGKYFARFAQGSAPGPMLHPAGQLAKHGLKPRDLLDATQMHRFRPLYEEYLRRTEDHLDGRLAIHYYAAGSMHTHPSRLLVARSYWHAYCGRTSLGQRAGRQVSHTDQPIRYVAADTPHTNPSIPHPEVWNGLFDLVRKGKSG